MPRCPRTPLPPAASLKRAITPPPPSAAPLLRSLGERVEICDCLQRTTDAPQSSRQPPPLPPQQFHTLFTPFPRSFSSFPHGTCSLSVSCPYLASGAIYHLLWAAFPSNPTRRRPVLISLPVSRGSHPLRHCLPADSHSHTHQPRPPALYNSHRWVSKAELLPLHSPLLGESLLFSAPPLTDMLKFSGSSCVPEA